MTRVLVALEMYSCNGLGLMDFTVPSLAQVGVTSVPGGMPMLCAELRVPTPERQEAEPPRVLPEAVRIGTHTHIHTEALSVCHRAACVSLTGTVWCVSLS
jgi:hypothetical protein